MWIVYDDRFEKRTITVQSISSRSPFQSLRILVFAELPIELVFASREVLVLGPQSLLRGEAAEALHVADLDLGGEVPALGSVEVVAHQFGGRSGSTRERNKLVRLGKSS